jgi:hypothetical protein
MWRMLAFICAALIVAAAFSMPAQAQRGAHFSGARASGAHYSGGRMGSFSGARVGTANVSGGRIAGGTRFAAAPLAGRGMYRGGVGRGYASAG